MQPSGARALSIVAAISGLYDAVVGAGLLLFPAWMASAFGAPPPVPPVFADLLGIFLLSVAAGYWLPYREPLRYSGYLWVMGPLLKGAGAAAFVLDYLLRGSPAMFLLFAASDGTLAAITLVVLLRSRASLLRTGNTAAVLPR